MLTAQEARQKALEIIEKDNLQTISEIEHLINASVKRGLFALNYYKKLPDSIHQNLVSKGYTIDVCNHIDEITVTIS